MGILGGFNLDKLLEYFLEPKKSGYDAPKTIVYGVLFILAAYSIYETLKRLKIKIDWRLAVSIAPYIILGSSVRVLEDLQLIGGYFFVTPGIYVFIFLITFFTILISLFLEKKRGIPYFKVVFTFGVLLLSIPISILLPYLITNNNLYGAALAVAFFIPWVILFKFVRWGSENKLATLTQMFDATVTFVSLQFFNFYEQHILPTTFITVLGPVSFIFVKVVAMVVLLIVIDKLSKDIEFNTYIKLIIGVLGVATGTRDFLALMALG